MLKTRAGAIIAEGKTREGGEAGLQRFLRLPEVKSITGLPTSTIYEQMDAGLFPRPVHISPRSAAWLQTEVAEWQAARVAERDARVKAA
jgi:prophage regulatory protein